jgi:hypothetical protein
VGAAQHSTFLTQPTRGNQIEHCHTHSKNNCSLQSMTRIDEAVASICFELEEEVAYIK